ncbi:MAG: OmpA family protein [Spirochaetes bacterium]|nr:OmpA family protein [Spirochaetota bacterium]
MKKYMLLLFVFVVFVGVCLVFSGCATQQEAAKEEVSAPEEKPAPESAPEPAPKEEPKEEPAEEKDIEIVQRIDSDGDGVSDDADRCDNSPAGAVVDEYGCPKDSDNDGVYDGLDMCPGTGSGVKVDVNGCPAAGPSGKVGRYKVVLEFDSDSASVRTGYYNMYKEQLTKIREKNPSLEVLRVEVYGHSDSTGTERYNMELSERRARSVSRFITTRFGVDQKLVETRAYGEMKPVASNRSSSGRQKNRRVEVYLTVKNLDF